MKRFSFALSSALVVASAWAEEDDFMREIHKKQREHEFRQSWREGYEGCLRELHEIQEGWEEHSRILTYHKDTVFGYGMNTFNQVVETPTDFYLMDSGRFWSFPKPKKLAPGVTWRVAAGDANVSLNLDFEKKQGNIEVLSEIPQSPSLQPPDHGPRTKVVLKEQNNPATRKMFVDHLIEYVKAVPALSKSHPNQPWNTQPLYGLYNLRPTNFVEILERCRESIAPMKDHFSALDAALVAQIQKLGAKPVPRCEERLGQHKFEVTKTIKDKYVEWNKIAKFELKKTITLGSGPASNTTFIPSANRVILPGGKSLDCSNTSMLADCFKAAERYRAELRGVMHRWMAVQDWSAMNCASSIIEDFAERLERNMSHAAIEEAKHAAHNPPWWEGLLRNLPKLPDPTSNSQEHK